MVILVLGAGGREHALIRAIARSPQLPQLLCAPGSDAIAELARCHSVDIEEPRQVVELAKHESVDLVVVGPEAPLAAGVSDALREAGIACFGPSQAAAQLESSKIFAKEFMQRHGIPTPGYQVFDQADAADRYIDENGGRIVVKADGLAAGKGVAVCGRPEQAKLAIQEAMRDRRFGSAGARVLLEERLEGPEASFYAICDGERFVTLPAAQDFKRALDGDEGENTGGMGAYSPAPVISAALHERIVEQVIRPAFDGMRAEGTPYQGVLFVGLMIQRGEPYVIEFNARFGDPETQPLLARLESDLLPVLQAAAHGELSPDAQGSLQFGSPAVCVVMASEGYPRSYPKGVAIEGIAGAEALDGVTVYHAGTQMQDGRWQTNGGRVLGVTARGATLRQARQRAYEAVAEIRWDGAHWRTDIARAVADSE